jgi:hypothetical protein
MADELLSITTLDEESTAELELGTREELLTFGFVLELYFCCSSAEELLGGGGGNSMSEVQEKSSAAQSVARDVGRRKSFFIVCSPC